MRADPILKSISSLSMSIINEEKLKCEDDEVDFHSDDEDDKCIELSLDSSGTEDRNQPAVFPPRNSFKTTSRARKIEFSKLGCNSYLNTMTCPLDAESSDSESEELEKFNLTIPAQNYHMKKSPTPEIASDQLLDVQTEELSISRTTVSSISNFEDLQTVEERTIESEDEDVYKKGSASPIKIKYSSNINFDSLSKSGLKDLSEARFLRIKNLQRNYIVHYINKPDTDFRLSLEFLKRTKTLSIDIEATNK